MRSGKQLQQIEGGETLKIGSLQNKIVLKMAQIISPGSKGLNNCFTKIIQSSHFFHYQ